MPGSGNSNGFDARRFAALISRFDMGNPSEEEAMNAARAMRRMAETAGLRVVDALERPDVRQALDDQMKPVRQDSGALQEARIEAETLRRELTERTRDVRKLAEQLTQERARGARPAPAPGSHPSVGGINGVLIAAVVVIVAALLVGSLAHRESSNERTMDHAMGSNQGEGVRALPQGVGLLHVPNPHRLPRRVHRGGTSGDVQPVRKFPRPPAESVAGPVK